MTYTRYGNRQPILRYRSAEIHRFATNGLTRHIEILNILFCQSGNLYGGPQASRQKLLKTTQTLSFTRPVGITAKVHTEDVYLTAEVNFTEISSES